MFPVETWTKIFQFVRCHRDLSQICLTSHGFNHEASLVLYHSVSLSNGWDQLSAFNRTVTARDTRIGERVVRLSITLHPNVYRDHSLSVEQRLLLHRTLLALPKLRVLEFTAPATPFDSRHMAAVFEDCPFQLEKFINSDIPFDETVNFLAKQPSIRSWEHLEDYWIRFSTIDEALLPNLSTVDIDERLLPFTNDRPIKHMRLRVRELGGGLSLEDCIRTIGLLRHTLTALSLGRVVTCGTVTEIAAGLSCGVLPHLVHLTIGDDYIVKEPNFPGQTPVDFSTGLRALCDGIRHFQTLETFVYSPSFDHHCLPWWSTRVTSRTLAQVVACAIFASCASPLRLVALPDAD
ncbi:hypothetical protein JAAARDRAFT_208433, partial [Jaapia argillacea MUCL 33604]